MFMMKLVIAAAVVLAGAFGMKWCNQRCQSRFGHAFFTKRAFMFTTLAMLLAVIGYTWRDHALYEHGDPLNGLVVMCVGALFAGMLVFENVRRMGAMYGMGGSLLQLGVLGALAWVSLPVMIIFAFGYVLWMSRVRPVYVANRR